MADSGIVENSSKVLRWMQTVIALILVIAGLGMNWGITKAEMATQKTQIAELKEDVRDEQKLRKAEVDKLKVGVLELQLGKAANDQLMVTIQSTLDEIKSDVKAIRRSR